ncbi:hypothetical protein [Gilvimarinus japonicus]|uniref:Uncharacterized protein n=1 Tax=Gilvimarinus japonicus TaxID=1796469 RepID=A0ABV7HN08_9GAMM
MNPVDIFFGGKSTSGDGGLPSMPRNAGHCARLAGNHMPAPSLINVLSANAAGGTITFSATAHGLPLGSTGTLWVSGANEDVFNGTHTYQVIDANTFTSGEPNGDISNMTGTVSAAIDTFDGDYYEVPVNSSDNKDIKVAFARYNSTGAQVWSVDFAVRNIFLGFSMSRNGNLLYAMTSSSAASMGTIYVVELDKATGASVTVSETTGYEFGSGDYWPGGSFNKSIRLRNDHSLPYAEDGTVDLSRAFFDVMDDGNFLFLGTSKQNGGETVSQPNNVSASFSGSEVLSSDFVCFSDGVTPLGFPTQYITEDGKVKLGQIMSVYHPWRFSFEGRLSTISRGNTASQFEIPNDGNKFFKLDRRRESSESEELWMIDSGAKPSTGGALADASEDVFKIYGNPFSGSDQANPYYPNQSELTLESVSSSGYRAFPEPIKIHSVGDFVFISASQISQQESSIKNTLLVGSFFVRRKDFDEWLNSVCDHLGLPE